MPEAVLTGAVVAAAQAGDGEAFRAIYTELAGSVLGYLRARGVSDPEGATSEVFLAVFRRLPDLVGGVDGLRKLTYSIAHARLVDDARSRSRTPDRVEYVPAVDTRVSSSAEDHVLGRMSSDHVLSVLRELPIEQREVLALRFVADLSIEQVAYVMERSVGAVKQLQRRALIAARLALAERGVTR